MSASTQSRKAPAGLDLVQMSSAQRRMWVAQSLDPSGTAYHITRALRFTGDVDVQRLGAAVTREIERHEALRTGVLVAGGRPVLRVAAQHVPDLTVRELTADQVDVELARIHARSFAFDGQPVQRIALWRTDAEHILVLVAHHLVMDATSLDLIVRGLVEGYRRRPGEPDLRPLPTSFREGVEVSRGAGATAVDRDAWVSDLAGMEPLRLTSHLPPAPTGGRPGALLGATVPGARIDALRPLARTIAPVVLGIYATVLHRLASAEDVIIGLPISTRLDARSQLSAGLFVSTVPVRVSLAGNPSLAEVVRRSEAALATALARPDVPVEDVVAALGLERQPGRDPLFEVTLGVLPPGEDHWEFDGVTVRLQRWYGGHAKFDCHLEVVESGPGRDLALTIEHDLSSLPPGLAKSVLDAVLRVVEQGAENPDIRTRDLVLAEPLSARHGTRPSGWPGRIDSAVREVAAANPEAIALESSHGATLTYAELVDRADAVAAAVLDAGVRPGSAVAVGLPRSPDLIVAQLAVLMAGCHYVPVDLDEPPTRIEHVLGASGAELLLSPAPIDFPLAHLDPRLVQPTTPSAVPTPVAGGEDTAYVLFTSGSSGLPKPVLVPHRGVLRLADEPAFRRGTWLAASTPLFDAATLETWVPLLRGDRLVILEGRPEVHALERVIRRGVDVCFLTSGLLNVMADENAEGLRGLGQLISGGDVMSAPHAQRVLEIVPEIVNLYGPTETSVGVTRQVLRRAESVPDRIPIGTSLLGNEIRVVDRTGRPQPPGAEGELVVTGPALAHGYRDDPRLTAEKFVPIHEDSPGARGYRTGDIAWVEPDGNVHFVGRRDAQVKVRGFRVELPEVERVAGGVPGVEELAVAVHVDAAGDKSLVGFYVGSLQVDELRHALLGLLPGHLRPTRWLRLEALPLGLAGKVDRAALLRTLDVAEPKAATDDEPVDELEQVVAGLYRDLLGSVRVTSSTDFLRAGGHSLLAARLVARLRTLVGVEISLAAVLSNPCLGDLVQLVRAQGRPTRPPLEARTATGRAPLSSGQERLWILERLNPGSARYHVPLRLRIRGELELAEVQSALDRVVQRHGALRTVLGEGAEGPWQEVLAQWSPTVSVTDLSDLGGPVRAAALEEIVERAVSRPFALEREPALRVDLVRLAADLHDLVIVVHHIVADGQSVLRILQDLLDPDAGASDAASAPCLLDYADVAEWEQGWLAGTAGKTLTKWWEQELRGVPQRLDWRHRVVDGATGGSVGEPNPAAGGLHRFTLGPGSAARVREAARASGTTAYAILLAVFSTVIGRRARADEFLVGTPVAGRTESTTIEMVGPFVNTVPIRCRLRAGSSFAEHVSTTTAAAVRALGHAELPFQRIVSAARTSGRADPQPLVQVLFAVQPSLGVERRWGARDIELVRQHTGTSKFDLAMSLFEGDDDLEGYVEYGVEVFPDPEMAISVAREFADLLARVLDEPDAPLDEWLPEVPDQAGAASSPAAGDEGAGLPPSLARVGAALGSIWREVLGVDPADGDDFFALGGHSLAATRVVSRVRRDLHREVSLQDLFAAPTLAGFAALIAVAEPVRTQPALTAAPPSPTAPLTMAQQRLWVRRELGVDEKADIVALQYRVDGRIAPERLAEAFTRLAVRHPVLRTTFEAHDGVPVQVVQDPRPVQVAVHDAGGDVDAHIDRLSKPGWDLRTTPPWEVHLVLEGERTAHLLLVLHHLLVDGWSVSTLLRELDALLIDPGVTLPSVGATLADVAHWQRAVATPDRVARAAAPLREQPELALPTDRPRSDPSAGRGHEVPLLVDARTRAALEDLAGQHSTSLFTVLLAVQGELLHRYSGQSRIVVGTHHAGRTEPGTEAVVGNLVNTVAVAVDAGGRPTWRELIERTAENVSVALTHADVAYERVLAELDVDRAGMTAELFRTMCVLQNLPDVPRSLAGHRLTFQPRPYPHADVDVAIWWTEDAEGGLRGGLVADSDLWELPSIQAMAQDALELVHSVASEPDGEAGACARRRCSRRDTDQGEAEGPLDLIARWRAVVAADGTRPAVLGLGHDGQLTTTTHQELWELVASLSRELAAQGAGPECRVAALLPRSVESIATWLAVLAVGACYVPVDTGLPRDRVETLLDLAGAELIVQDDEGPAVPGRKVLRPRAGNAVAEPVIRAGVPGEALAYLIFTSGSTGRPKPVMVTRNNLQTYLRGIEPELALGPDDRVLNFASVSFDASTEEVYPALLAGGAVVLRPDGVTVPAEGFDRLLELCQPTVLSLPVTFWRAWTEILGARSGSMHPAIHTVLLNAEEPTLSTYDAWLGIAGASRVKVINTYGPTEGTVTASLYPISDATPAEPHRVWGRMPVGVALATMTMEVVDPQARTVPRGAPGELVLGGSAVTRGYSGMPAATAAAYRPDPNASVPGARRYHTGDVARVLPDGSTSVAGRVDRQVKIRGYRVEPGEVESIVSEACGNAPVVVVGRSGISGLELVAFVESPADTFDGVGLRRRLLESHPAHLVPARIEAISGFPMTSNAKVDRAGLQERATQLRDRPRVERVPAAEALEPSTPEEVALQAVFIEVLGRDDVGLDDGFFGLGGDSISALVVVSRARERGVELTAADVFAHHTVRDLAAAAVASAAAGPDAETSPAGQIAAAASALSRRQLARAASRLRGQ